MSAQAGIWNFDGSPAPAELLAKLSDAITQYGPDGESTYFDGPVGMLYRPFHTTVESRLERQPRVSPRGLVITWDGRLDNREELIPQLYNELMGEPTDVATVMAAYERWGTDCFRRLIGDWALSLWDPAERTLLLAKDYMGIRHLYYYLTEKRVVWCTHLAPIVLLSGVSFTLNDEYIAGYLAMYPEAHLTPYREIQAVPPGHFVTIRNGKATVHRYWSFEPKRRIRYKTDAEYEEHFRQVFRQAVRRRLRSDSPILAELSGGLDSSSIVCMADDILAKGEAEVPRVDTLSYYDKTEPQGDDWLYFTKVEEKRGRTGHHIDTGKYGVSFSVKHSTFLVVPGSLGDGQGPEAEQRAVMERGGYRAVLSGIGGDEFLGGVPEPRAQLADLIVQLRLGELARQLMAWSLVKRKPWIQLLFETFGGLLPPAFAARLLKEAKVESWVDKRFARQQQLAKRQLGPSESFGFRLPSRRAYARAWEVVSRQMADKLPPALCCEEKRYPYLDQSLVEFLISIPASQLLRPGERRSLMRRALANLLPPAVLSRRTKGIAARSYMLAVETHWTELEGIFRLPLGSHLGYVDAQHFQDDLRATRNGKSPHLVRMMKGISLELWLRDLAARGLIRVGTEIPLSVGTDLVHLRA